MSTLFLLNRLDAIDAKEEEERTANKFNACEYFCILYDTN